MDARDYLLKKHNSPYQLKLLKIIESCTNIEQRSTVYSWLARVGKLRVPVAMLYDDGSLGHHTCLSLLMKYGVYSEVLNTPEREINR